MIPVPNALTPPHPSLQLPCLPAAPGTIPLVLAAAASTRHSVKGRLRAFPSQEDHALIVTCGQQHFRACRTARTGAEVVKKSHCVLLPQHDCSSGGYVRLPTSRLHTKLRLFVLRSRFVRLQGDFANSDINSRRRSDLSHVLSCHVTENVSLIVYLSYTLGADWRFTVGCVVCQAFTPPSTTQLVPLVAASLIVKPSLPGYWSTSRLASSVGPWLPRDWTLSQHGMSCPAQSKAYSLRARTGRGILLWRGKKCAVVAGRHSNDG
jgi:hypothetical protein